ncbi:MAG: methylenetetrahydrofolate--tRNA-(uracil(54)-C(5))-methyltransferase (FADH(2)-oxidizing) TrmFO [Acidobacteriota bacterium]
MDARVQIIGGGLAGSEAAWQLARRGIAVQLHEMRPARSTPAHTGGDLAELVCSNSLRSDVLANAAGLLKEEMRRCGSIILAAADATAVPAGSALAVDRSEFARRVTDAITGHDLIALSRNETTSLPPEGTVAIVATGPLTSDTLATSIATFTGEESLYFYDAISPVVDAETIDMTIAFRASRYARGVSSGGDYLNCPLDEAGYRRFLAALLEAAPLTWHEFERDHFFEGCLPIEELARRGPDTLRFGPMKPVGLIDPATGRRPHAVVQLRQDNRAASHFSLVGFQNHLRWGDQERILRLIPGLAKARFIRFGQIHRNSFINSPSLLLPTYQTRRRSRLLFAGQIAGVEGYLESAAAGLIAGTSAVALALGKPPRAFPPTTALGALAAYISTADPAHFVPTNVTFGLFPPLSRRIRPRRERNLQHASRALADLEAFTRDLDLPDAQPPPGEPPGRVMAAVDRPDAAP